MKRYYYFILFSLTIFFPKIYAQYISAGNDFTVCNDETEITLHPNLRPTKSQFYVVQSIPFHWDDDLTGTEVQGTRSGSLQPLRDDDYSSPIDFPINFYFLGKSRNKIVIGSNGDLVFNTIAANKKDDYNYFDAGIEIPNQVLPYWDSDTRTSAIAVYGAAQDIDPGVRDNPGLNTTIQYRIEGTAPNRKFIVTYNEIPLFGCSSGSDLLYASQQIIFYEGTDVIEVNIKQRPVCVYWEHHAAAIGVQDDVLAPDTCGQAAPGRNTGDWTVDASSPESWRFVPNGNIISIKWYDSNRNVVATTESPTIPFDDTETYTLEVEFEDCLGNSFLEYDEVKVTKLPKPKNDLPKDNVLICANETYTFDGTVTNPQDYTNISYSWTDHTGNEIATTPKLTVDHADTYTLVTTVDGCDSPSEVTVEQYPYECKVPEGISPNGDDKNDFFNLEYLSRRQGIDKLEIFNRWGKLVYDKDDYVNEFVGKTNDGKELPAASYYYVIKLLDGEKLTGWLYIVR